MAVSLKLCPSAAFCRISPPARAQATLSEKPTIAKTVKLETLNDCKLGVAWYPDFVYNAAGGGDTAAGTGSSEDGKVTVQFNSNSLYVPALCYSTTKFLGLPLPPPLRIDIKPQVLKGVINQQTGEVELNFVAAFLFTAGSLYKAPALMVDTMLTTRSCRGKQRGGTGSKLDSEGRCKLVGVAEVSKVGDAFLDTFLALPSECLAEMRARITIT